MSAAALLLGSVAASSAFAETYYVGNFAQLSAAVSAATPDANSVIILTQDITMTANLSSVPKNVTIDTNGFTINGVTAVTNTLGNALTLKGAFRGTSQVGTGGTAFIQGTVSAPSFITNNASLFGGASSTLGGGLGAALAGGDASFTNNGTIIGGDGVTGGGNGLQVRQRSTVFNFGTIQGGNAPGAGGGMGVDLGGPVGSASSLTNAGIIRGGSGAGNGIGNSAGGIGVFVRIGNNPVVNSGLIEGNNAMAIAANGATVSLDIVNSGTIRAGAGQNAIGWQNTVTPTTGILTLDLRAGSVIEGNVVASSAGTADLLRLGGDANWTLTGGIGSAGQYRNFDKLEKTGASTWTVTTGGDFAGATNVLAGKLVMNGSLANSAFNVASGATLGGSGTLGATTIATGGTIAPGNSIGTVTVNGAYNQAAGSTYQVEVDPGTVTSDRIAVNGAATLATGANFTVVNYTGAAYQAGQRYTILTSTGGLTGNYGLGEQVLTPFLNMRDSYDANNAYLTVTRNATSVGSVGGTPNETQVGNSVDSLPSGNAVLDGVLNQANLANARGALNQLSGEIHASARAALIDESWILRNAVNDRLRAAFGGVGAPSMVTMNYGYTADLARSVKGPMPALSADRFALWGQGFGDWGRTGSDGNASTMSRSTGGFLLGGDVAAFDTFRFGVLAGYGRSNFDVKARASSGESDNYHLGLYGGGQWGALSLRTGASFTWHDVSTSRLVTAAYLGGNPRADYDASTAQVFGEVGYRMGFGGIELEPFAGLAYVNLHTGRFAETGAVTALSASGDDTGVGYSTLGLRASTRLAFGGADLTLRGGLAWRHAFGDVKPSVTMAFAGSTPFTISGLPIARDAAVIEAGADMAIGRNTTLGLAYNGQLGQDTQDHSFKGVLAVKF